MKIDPNAPAYPATAIVHTPSGPVPACERHAVVIVSLIQHLGGHAVCTTTSDPHAECRNCENEARIFAALNAEPKP